MLSRVKFAVNAAAPVGESFRLCWKKILGVLSVFFTAKILKSHHKRKSINLFAFYANVDPVLSMCWDNLIQGKDW